ncbi:MAG: enoyl-CoA hydratase/isomerase family protein [Caldilineaceae bacterium]|nr:enoyl-CoA hydratase/isomerase family protein [Caldilineaceae bacterium]
METLLLSRKNGVATLTINRPGMRNAINLEMWRSLAEIAAQLEQDNSVHVVVLQGAGDEAFSAGGDIAEFSAQRSDPWQAKIYNGKVELALKSIARLSKPTIALVRGFAVGGGCMLAAHCDLRICADNAIFGMPVAQLSTLVGYRELQRFVHLIGLGATLDLLLTARLVEAAEAQAIGLCSQIYPLGEIDEKVAEMTERMTSLAPLAQRWHKQMLQTLLRKPDLHDLTPEEGMLPDAIYDSEDYAEGVRAFLGKRAPNFRGR